jgi:hypothetical protein
VSFCLTDSYSGCLSECAIHFVTELLSHLASMGAVELVTQSLSMCMVEN